MRFNAYFRGKRTTVRVPDFLVRLHKVVVGFDTDDQVIEDLKLCLLHDEENAAMAGHTASQVCCSYIEWNVLDSLNESPIAFNRDPENGKSAFSEKR